MSTIISRPEETCDVDPGPVGLFDVDMDIVPACEAGRPPDRCGRPAMWIMRKWCGCSLLFCEPCRVGHWEELLSYDALPDPPVEAHCTNCGAAAELDPDLPLYWQLVVKITLL